MAFENPYANVGGMKLQLSKLQDNNKEAKLIKDSTGLSEVWEDVEGVLQYQGLPYVPAIICSVVRSRHHNDPLVGHFGIDETRELVGRKYYWLSLRKDVKSCVRGCDVYLLSKTIRYNVKWST